MRISGPRHNAFTVASIRISCARVMAALVNFTEERKFKLILRWHKRLSTSLGDSFISSLENFSIRSSKLDLGLCVDNWNIGR